MKSSEVKIDLNDPKVRMLLYILGASLLALILYWAALSPYLDARRAAIAAIAKAQDQHKHDTDLITNQPKVSADWKALTTGKLKTKSAEASSQINDALFDWARAARFSIQDLTPSRPAQSGDFQQIDFKLTGEASTESFARFLYYLESTDLPLQIQMLNVTTHKEGINDLTVILTVSTIVFSPSTAKAAPKPTSGDDL